MQYSIIALAFAALAAATPLEKRQAGICGSSIDTPVCCQTSVEDVLELECSPPSGDPTTAEGVREACADTGLTAQCCLLNTAGLGVVCSGL